MPVYQILYCTDNGNAQSEILGRHSTAIEKLPYFCSNFTQVRLWEHCRTGSVLLAESVDSGKYLDRF